MSTELLMSPKPLRWQDEAVCEGDARFTGREEWLTSRDIGEMAVTCLNCPVFSQCSDWADSVDQDGNPAVIEVFAAAYWRKANGPDDVANRDEQSG